MHLEIKDRQRKRHVRKVLGMKENGTNRLTIRLGRGFNPARQFHVHLHEHRPQFCHLHRVHLPLWQRQLRRLPLLCAPREIQFHRQTRIGLPALSFLRILRSLATKMITLLDLFLQTRSRLLGYLWTLELPSTCVLCGSGNDTFLFDATRRK